MKTVESGASSFAQRVRSFLECLKFADVNGGAEPITIGHTSVDVAAGHEDTLLVCRCLYQRMPSPKIVQARIKDLRDSHLGLCEGIKHHQPYGRYRHIRLVLAVHKYSPTTEDLQFANAGTPRVYIWGEHFLEYYEKLYETIGQYAKFNLLGEMGIRPKLQTSVSVPAFKVRLGGAVTYLFFMNPRDLLEVSYVARRDTGNERFYQRIVKKTRLGQIAKYIDEGNVIPNNLIIAFNDELSPKVKFNTIAADHKGKCTAGQDTTYGILEFPRDYRSCWIIDGQHRLYAYTRAKTDSLVPVVAFQGLELERQCRIFLDINKNQKPVPPDLVWDLNGYMIPNEEDGILSNVVKRLNDAGPLKGRIRVMSRPTAAKRGLLRMAGLCMAMRNAGLARSTTASRTQNPFYDNDASECVKKLHSALSDYFGEVKHILSDDWSRGAKGFCLDTKGCAVLVAIFEKIVSRRVAATGRVTTQDYYRYISPLVNYFAQYYPRPENITKLKREVASAAGMREVVRDFILYIREETRDTSFGGDIGIDDAVRQTTALEGKLRELVSRVLRSQYGDGWFENPKCVASDIRSRAIKHAKRHVTDPQRAWTQLTLGECTQLVNTHWKLFENVFIGPSEGFTSQNEVQVAFGHISRIRVHSGAHDIEKKPLLHDRQQFNISYDKLIRCIEAALAKF